MSIDKNSFQPDIDIIIVNYNSSSYLQSCMNSLVFYTKVSFRVIIVDNCSEIDDLLNVETIVSNVNMKCECILIKSPINIGFGRANNLALPHLLAPYTLLLNPDTELLSDVIDSCLKIMKENIDFGCVSPVLVNVDGSYQNNWYQQPSLTTTFKEYFLRQWQIPLPKATNLLSEVDGVVGAFMLIRQEIVKSTHLFDPAYFMYVEEVDLCKRIRDSGWKIGIIPDLYLIHIGGGSSSKGLNYFLYFELHKNRLIYADKYFTGLDRILMIALIKIGVSMNIFATSMKFLVQKCTSKDVSIAIKSAYEIMFLKIKSIGI
jgi:GT2 family glycosyltransferase